MKPYLELEKLSKENGEKNREKHAKKVNAWAGISKSGKTSIQIFTENKTKELFVSIMEKIWKKWK